MDGLVALETRQSDSEITNHQRTGAAYRSVRLGTGEHNGGSTAVGRVNRWPVFAGSGGPGQETGSASGSFGGGSGPGDGCRRRSGGWSSGSGGRKDRVYCRPEGSGR